MVWNPFYTFLRYKEIRLFQNKILIYTSKYFDHHFKTNMIVKIYSTSIIFTFKIINEAASYCLSRSLSPFKFISANTCSSESTDTHLQRICTFSSGIISWFCRISNPLHKDKLNVTHTFGWEVFTKCMKFRRLFHPWKRKKMISY